MSQPGPFDTDNALPDRIDGKCVGFAWVGQSFASCDVCGQPFWEHEHNREFIEGREERVRISAELAAAVRGKWEGRR